MNKPKYIQGDVVKEGVITICNFYGQATVRRNNDEGTRVYEVDDLTPSAVTTKILEKNGWKKHKDTYGFTRYCFKRKGYPKLSMINEIKVTFHWGGYDKEVFYVHELQHLLFGLGLENRLEV